DRFGLHRDGPSVRPDNSQNHGQAQAPSSRLAGEKRAEDLFDILFRDPAALVLNFEASVGMVARPPIQGEAAPCWNIRRRNRLDGQVNGAPAVTARLPGIGHEVGQDLLYLA